MKKQKIMGIGVGVIVFNEKGKVLLGKRSENEKNADSKLRGAGHWTMPGGKVDFGEKVIDAVKREAKEETDLDLQELEMIALNEDMIENVHFLTVGFLAKKWSGTVKTMEPEAITEWQWFDLENLPEKVFFPSKKLLNNLKENKFFIENNL